MGIAVLSLLVPNATACGLAPEPPGAFYLWDGTDSEPVTIVIEAPHSGADCGLSTQFAFNGEWFVWQEGIPSDQRLFAWSAATNQTKNLGFSGYAGDLSLEGDTLYIWGGDAAPFAPFYSYDLRTDQLTHYDIFVPAEAHIRLDGQFAIITERPAGNHTYRDGQNVTVLDLVTESETTYRLPNLDRVGGSHLYDKVFIDHYDREWLILTAWSGWWRDDPSPMHSYAYNMASDELFPLDFGDAASGIHSASIVGDTFYYEETWWTNNGAETFSHSEIRGLDLRSGQYEVLGSGGSQFTGTVVNGTMVFGAASTIGYPSPTWVTAEDIPHRTPAAGIPLLFLVALAGAAVGRRRDRS